MAKRHEVPAANHKEMISWLEENVQENFYEKGFVYDTHTGPFSKHAEWISKDGNTWKFSLYQHLGLPNGKAVVEINDPKAEVIFLLMWT